MDSVCLNTDLLRLYPNVRVKLFISTTDLSASGFDYDHVTNSVDGYVTELEQTVQATSEMGTQIRNANPYSTELMPITPLDDILGVTADSILESVEFLGYDATLIGSIYQDADNNTEINNSQALAIDAYMASHFRNGILGNWQPNYCRPRITVDDDVILDTTGSQVKNAQGVSTHLGHESIGIPLPFGAYYYKGFSNINSIRVFAGLAQWIATSVSANKLQRYPVMCIQKWRTRY